MNMRDKVLYIIIGVLIGVVVMQWQQGPQPVQAQAPEPINGWKVFGGDRDRHFVVMLSNGDVYLRLAHETNGAWSWFNDTAYLGNFWTTIPIQTNQSTWGAIKALNSDGK
jgi:hypothetical protein